MSTLKAFYSSKGTHFQVLCRSLVGVQVMANWIRISIRNITSDPFLSLVLSVFLVCVAAL
jgi:hypothetical protein